MQPVGLANTRISTGYVQKSTRSMLRTSITLFSSITMFCEIDNILHNILHVHDDYRNILHKIISAKEQCYGSE